jgi:hypothetical protein
MGIAEQRFASSSSAEHLRVTVEVALAVAVVVVAEASAWWACGSHTSVQQRRLTGLERRVGGEGRQSTYWVSGRPGEGMRQHRIDPPARGSGWDPIKGHVREPTRDHTAAAKGLERGTLRRGEASADTSAIAIEAAEDLG